MKTTVSPQVAPTQKRPADKTSVPQWGELWGPAGGVAPEDWLALIWASGLEGHDGSFLIK